MKVVDVSGVLKAEAYEASYKEQDLFIKEYPEESADSAVLNEASNAKYLFALGLGPKVQVVKVKNARYLVMDKLSGINIKEVTTDSESETTKVAIEKMLKIKTKSIKEARKLFAHHIISSEGYFLRIYKIQKILEDHNFKSTFDMQFMINLQKGPESIKIIDSYFFKRNTHADDISSIPSKSFERIINSLRALTEL